MTEWKSITSIISLQAYRLSVLILNEDAFDQAFYDSFAYPYVVSYLYCTVVSFVDLGVECHYFVWSCALEAFLWAFMPSSLLNLIRIYILRWWSKPKINSSSNFYSNNSSHPFTDPFSKSPYEKRPILNKGLRGIVTAEYVVTTHYCLWYFYNSFADWTVSWLKSIKKH